MTRAARRLVMVLLLALALPASAKDMNGKFGFGINQTFGGVSGFGFQYFFTRSLALNVDVGVSFASSDASQSSTAFVGGLGIFYALVQHRTANLLIGLRGDFGVRSAPSDAPEATLSNAVNRSSTPNETAFSGSVFQFNLEIPLVIEYFFSDSVSFHVAAGALLVFVPEQGAFLDAKGVAFENASFILALGSGGFLGSAGVTFWF